MLRSMYAGISGLRNFQTKLDVIGNNIANVNTYGFKKGRTTFSDLVSQQMEGASAPTFDRGGMNPKQVGLGSQIASIDTIHTQGSLQTTGRSLDLGISGDGFFIVQDGFNHYYTRSGNFYLDHEGNLVNSDGLRVMGYGVDPDSGGIDRTAGLTALQISQDVIVQPETSSITAVGNFNINNLIDTSTGNPTANPVQTLTFKIFDEDGVEYEGQLRFHSPVGEELSDESGYYVSELEFQIIFDGNSEASGTIEFNEDGTVKNDQYITNDVTFPITGGTDIVVPHEAIDFSELTVLNYVQTADVIGDEVFIESYNIGSSGVVNAVLSDGSVRTLGQIALANFNNAEGLEKAGNNLFKDTVNSGDPQIGVAGDGMGTINGAMLEMSNVDLSEEFTEMIVSQRGFQANTRIITTSDEILQELVNLKR